MRKHHITFVAIVSTFLFSSCADSKSTPVVTSADPIENTAAVIDKNIENLTEEKQNEIGPQVTTYTATCVEKEETDPASPESEDPIITRTCTYRNYKTILIGSADYKGRYSWEYNLFKLNKGEYAKIENSSLFNQRQNDLLNQINQKIKADYIELSSAPETKDCFDGAEPIRDFKMDELNISFETDKLVFHLEFGLTAACLSVGGTSVSFKMKEIEPFLNK